MEQNIMLLCAITAVVFFIVANPMTYAIMSKITTLRVKNKNEHFLLVGIHAVVMTLLMFAAFNLLIIDRDPCPSPKKCPPPPPPPPPKPCPICDSVESDEAPEGGESNNVDTPLVEPFSLFR